MAGPQPARPSCKALLLLLAAGLLVLTLSWRPVAASCEVGQQKPGCRIHGALCVCGIGCRNDYMYSTKEECVKAINGQGKNVCASKPCENDGACSQSNAEPGYKCRCDGTGFYGPRCQYKCPSASAVAAGRAFPYECVVI